MIGIWHIVHRFPPGLHSRTTILFCGTNETVANLPSQPGEKDTCVGLNCFHFCPLYGNCSLTHRLRLCNEGDLTFITNMCWILVLCQALALVSTYRLNALADYEKLWKASRKTPCFGMDAIVHRSLTYKFIKERNPKELKMALEDSTEEAAVRQNPAGFAPTTFAIKEGAVDCLEVLFNCGVEIEEYKLL